MRALSGRDGRSRGEPGRGSGDLFWLWRADAEQRLRRRAAEADQDIGVGEFDLPLREPNVRSRQIYDEPQYTGTGFPKVFYLKYHLYRVYFPLMALARYQAAIGRLAEPATTAPGALASRIPATPRAFEV